MKRKDILPLALADAARKRVQLFNSKYVLELTALSFADQALRAHLAQQGGYTDRSEIFRLYIYDKTRRVYYDWNGRRLGDDLGINDWFLQKG